MISLKKFASERISREMRKEAVGVGGLRNAMRKVMRRGKDYVRFGWKMSGNGQKMSTGKNYVKSMAGMMGAKSSGSALFALPTPSAKAMQLADKPIAAVIGNPNYDVLEMMSRIVGKTKKRAGVFRELKNRLKYMHEYHELQSLRKDPTLTGIRFFSHASPEVILKDLRLHKSLRGPNRSHLKEFLGLRRNELSEIKKAVPRMDDVKLNSKNIKKLSRIIESKTTVAGGSM